MGKSRVKFQCLREHRRRREKAKQEEPPVSWTWRERLAAVAVILIILGCGLGPYTAWTIHGHRRAIDRRIERLKAEFELNDTQVQQLRELELEFRGNGNPFSFRGDPSPTERAEYHERLNQLIGDQNSDEITESKSN